MEVVRGLSEKELALLVRRETGQDPNGMARGQLLAALGGIPAPEDHERLVGEVRQQLEAADRDDDDRRSDDPHDEAGGKEVSDEQVLSWQASFVTSMLSRNGPPASNPTDRFRWAKLLYLERLQTRERLDGAAGIALRLWDEEKRKFVVVPDSKKEELAVEASLMYCTPDGKQTCCTIAVLTGLAADFLLEVNKALYPSLKSVTDEFRKNSFIFLEDDIPTDMIDRLNDHFDLVDPDSEVRRRLTKSLKKN